MIYMNELMKSHLEGENNHIQELAKEIVDSTKIIYDCLVYDKKSELEEANINFDRILMMYGDRTGYEVACNEIRIDKFSKSQYLSFLAELDKEFLAKFSRQVAIYLLEYDDTLELRFHSLREGEALWLSENLDEYKVPVVYHVHESRS